MRYFLAVQALSYGTHVIKPWQPSMPSMKETFRKRVGNYYLGRTLGEVCCLPSNCMLPPQCDAPKPKRYQAVQPNQSEDHLLCHV